eukprot:scaffold4580_cov17-Tisochrysis_lutea.AAC.1
MRPTVLQDPCKLQGCSCMHPTVPPGSWKQGRITVQHTTHVPFAQRILPPHTRAGKQHSEQVELDATPHP